VLSISMQGLPVLAPEAIRPTNGDIFGMDGGSGQKIADIVGASLPLEEVFH